MKINRKIISLAFALALLIVFMLSATSCSTEAIFGSPTEQGSPTQPTPKPPYSDGVNDTQSGAGDSSSDEPIFHPEANNPADIEELSPEAKTLLSAVAIHAIFDIPDYYYGDPMKYTSYGSGVIYELDRDSGDALIITNYHVVFNADEINENGFSDEISLFLYGMEDEQYAVNAVVVGGSMTYDLALLRVENSEVIKNSMAIPATFGDSEGVRVFDEVLAVGNPEGRRISVTEGIVSVYSEPLKMVGADGRTSITVRVMRISAAINDGNSGGGLYDTDGRLIAVVNAKRTGEEIDNIAYALPVYLVERVVKNILYNCDGETNLSVKKVAIGVEIDPLSSGLVADGDRLTIVEQVGISKIYDTCITDRLAVGDIINSITIDGKTTKVTRNYHVTENLLLVKAGSTLVLNLTRGEETFDLTLVIPAAAISAIK